MNRLISIVLSSLLIFFPLFVSAQQSDSEPRLATNEMAAITDPEFLEYLKKVDNKSEESVIIYLNKQSNWAKEIQKLQHDNSINMLQPISSKISLEQDSFLATYSIKQSEKFWLGNAISATLPIKKIKLMANDPRVDMIIQNKMVQIPDLERQMEIVEVAKVDDSVPETLPKPDINEEVDKDHTKIVITPDPKVGIDPPPTKRKNTNAKEIDNKKAIVLKPSLDTVQKVTYDWGIEKIGANKVWELLGITGKNIRVAVVDTGIHADHPDLAGRVVGWADFINNQKSPYDDEGHGTHVSGTIGGNGLGGFHSGVAPDVQLMGAKVLNHEGKGEYSTVIAGMQWSVENGANIINLSLGGEQTDAFNPVFEDINLLGIFPVISAGNSGPEPSTIGSPGSHPNAFTIGASDFDDNIAPFSSRGPVQLENGELITKPDVVAPGVDITSTWNNGGYARISGTSMATPYTAGTVALLKEAFPTATINDIKNLITQNSVPLGKSQPNNDSGWGRIDVYQTILSGYQNGTLTGQVMDSTTFEPLMGAKIAILEKNTEVTTDMNGQFSISLPAGTYTISASSFLYDHFETEVTIVDKNTTNLDVKLNPQPSGSLSGSVVDVRNQPIPSVEIKLHTSNQTLFTHSDKHGQFYFERAPQGKWSIEAHSYRISPVQTMVNVQAYENNRATLVAYRTIATESFVGNFKSNHIPLDTSEDGTLVIAGTTADVNDDSEPNLFALNDSGKYLWTAKLGDRVNVLAVSKSGSLIATAHIGASFGTFEDDFSIQKGKDPDGGGKEPDDVLPPAPWQAPTEVTKGDGLSILTRDGHILSTVQAEDLSGQFAISNKEDLILYAGKSLYIWNNKGTLLKKVPLEAPAYGMDLSGDGKIAAIALMNGKLITFDIKGTSVNKKKDWVVTSKGWPWSVSINQDGSIIVVGEYTEDVNNVGHIRAYNNNGQIKWNVQTGWHVNRTDMSEDGSIVAAGSWDGKLYVINGKTGKLLYTRTPGRPDNTLIDAQVRVKVSPNGERIAASFLRANLVNVYSQDGKELASQFSYIHPVSLTGMENLTRLIIAGPTILADGLTGPSEIAYIDTPDAAYMDTNRLFKNNNSTINGAVRYGDYGWNYYLDIDYLKRAYKVRWISQSPAAENAVFLPQTGNNPVATLDKGRARFTWGRYGNPISLQTGMETPLTIQSVFSSWSLQPIIGKRNEEQGVFTIKRY